MTVVAILGWMFTLLGLCGAAYALLTFVFVARFAAKPNARARSFPPVTVLKPLHGAEPGLKWSLETFFLQQYAGDVQLVFGVHDSNDPAVGIIEELRARYPRVNAVLVSDTRRHAANPKISNILGMASVIRNDVLVLSDSDIAVAPNYLEKVVGALETQGVGAVTCLYAGWAATGFASRLTAMGVTYQFLPNVIAGVSLGLARPCFGSTIAVTRRVLDSIGGFAAFASVLADDYEIGRAVRAKGYDVFIPSFVVRHACGEFDLGQWFHHELRWLRTIRAVDPAGHWGSIITQAFPLALVGSILAGFSAFSLAAVAVAAVARGLLKWQIDRAFGVPGGPLWLLPLRDVLSFGVYLMSLFGGAVVWQDERLQVSGDGALLDKVRQ